MPTLRSLLSAAVLAALLIVPATASAVVGGQNATRAYPNMVELREGGVFYCGASLVAPNKVLTAAHCVHGTATSRFSFVIGRTQRSDDSTGEVIPAASIEVHPSYDENSQAYDVAVVTLQRNATKGTPIRLATPSERSTLWAPGDTATVTGWGARAGFDLLGLTGTDRLQEVRMPIRDDAECDSNYSLTMGGIDANTMFCAGELHGTKDSCQGDSGGPLMVADTTGALVQAGVVSWGFGCGYPTQYGVYARTSGTTLYNWVTARI